MQLHAKEKLVNGNSIITAHVPPTRSDILHPCDVVEIFEVGDIVSLDVTRDVGASNNCRLAALYCNSDLGFEEIAGLVGRIMQAVRKPNDPLNDNFKRPSNEPEFFLDRQYYIIYKDKQTGAFGVVHPEVLEKFRILDPCSFAEIDIQALL